MLWLRIKGHKSAMSLFIIVIHFSGGEVKLSHKKHVMEMWAREEARESGKEED